MFHHPFLRGSPSSPLHRVLVLDLVGLNVHHLRVDLVLLAYSFNAGPISVDLSFAMVSVRVEHVLSVDAPRIVVFHHQ